MDAVFFATPEAFRAWLAANHETAPELIVGYFKKGTGLPEHHVARVGRPGAVLRMDRRRPAASTPSATASGSHHVAPAASGAPSTSAGSANSTLQAWSHRPGTWRSRHAPRSGRGSTRTSRRRTPVLSPEAEARFRANAVAWAYFCAQPPSYRRTVIHLVTSAKKPETRERRLEQLIAHCAEEQPIPQLRWGAKAVVRNAHRGGIGPQLLWPYRSRLCPRAGCTWSGRCPS